MRYPGASASCRTSASMSSRNSLNNEKLGTSLKQAEERAAEDSVNRRSLAFREVMPGE